MAVGTSNPSNFEYLSDERRTSYNISTIKLTKGAASANVKGQGHEDQEDTRSATQTHKTEDTRSATQTHKTELSNIGMFLHIIAYCMHLHLYRV